MLSCQSYSITFHWCYFDQGLVHPILFQELLLKNTICAQYATPAREADWCLAQSSPVKFLPVADGNKYRPQADNTQRARDLQTVSPNERRTPRDPGLVNQQERSTHELTETEAHAQGLRRSAPDGVLEQKGDADTWPHP